MTGSLQPLLKASSFHSISPTIPYLPFLYQTRTILQPWLQYPSRSAYQQTRQFAIAKKRPKLAKEDTSTGATREIPSIQTQVKRRARKPVFSNEEDNSSTKRSNTFLEILQEHASKPAIKLPHTRRRAVTMTQKEQEVFERLQNISGKKKIAQAEPKLPNGLNNEVKEEELSAIFENIPDTQKPATMQDDLRLQQQGASRNAKNEKEELPTMGAKHRSSKPTTDQPGTTSDTVISKQSQARPGIKSGRAKDTKKTVQGADPEELLALVKLDRELWQQLDKRVFQDMRDLAVLLKEREGSRTQVTSSASKIKPQEGKARQSAPGLSESSAEESKPRPDLLEKVTNSYGPALLQSARVFRTRFPCSPYAALLLPTIKKLGPISYVLAGSTALYNELLYIRWVYYRDLNGCADLVEDMVSHNILADERTSVVLQMANKTRAKETSTGQSGQRGDTETKDADGTIRRQDVSRERSSTTFGTPVASFVAGWWQLQGIEAGWVRWINSYEQLMAMTRKELQRQQEEQMLANQAVNLLIGEPESENLDTKHPSAERQPAVADALEPEIELLTSEDIDEPEVAAAA